MLEIRMIFFWKGVDKVICFRSADWIFIKFVGKIIAKPNNILL